jgi:hypothetical protein
MSYIRMYCLQGDLHFRTPGEITTVITVNPVCEVLCLASMAPARPSSRSPDARWPSQPSWLAERTRQLREGKFD